MSFTDRVRLAAIAALPAIQSSYDGWQPQRPGMGLCGIIARRIESSLDAFGIQHERIGENGHHYVLALSPSGEAVAVDVPWRLYESPTTDPAIDPFTDWSKIPGVAFGDDSIELTTIV